ncbi:cingulin-like [Mya arenaria]|uniref:cingulin-like n=1 Tax=Mya arenaria TaxID=6604 RepID=UPI0022E8589A|nr:cingulin-like [Mya arenaria]
MHYRTSANYCRTFQTGSNARTIEFKARKGLEKESLQAKQSLEKTEKTRKELCDKLKHVKHDLETSEKTRQELCYELKLVKQDLENSEKTRKQQCDELKQELDTSEKVRPFTNWLNTRQKLCDELERVKKDLDNSEKRRNTFEKDLLQAKLVTEQSEKKRLKLCDELEHVKQDLDHSEKTQNQLRDELKGVKQDLYHSEKTRKQFEQKLLKAKQDIKNSEKTQKELRDELKRVKQDLYHSEKTKKRFEQDLLKTKPGIEKSVKERAVVTAQLSPLKENIKWTQPTGTVDVKKKFAFINLIFTFPDGIQTTHHPSPGKPYKGGRFTGHLCTDSDGELLCRMLKAAFKKGLMFNFGKEGKVVLDGVTLYNRPLYDFKEWKTYDAYTQTLKAQLSAKGITEANIDQTEDLFETLNVNGSCLFDAAPSS